MNQTQSTNGIFMLILIVVAVVLIVFIRKKIKTIKIPAVLLITGAIKTGKSLLSVHLALKTYRKNVFKWWINRPFLMLLRKEVPLKPMLYSNMPLRWTKFNRFTYNILLRKVRIPDKSVVLLDEASLIADSMLFKDNKINDELMLFVKLFGHYTHGGTMIINTQAISDLHFSFKRSLNNYLYIYDTMKLPFITLMHVREMIYSDDNSMTNNFHEDIELSMRKVIIFNRAYKKYDRYYLSIFTDDLDYEVDYDAPILTKFDSLKADKLITLHSFGDLLEVHSDDGDK